MFVQEIRWSRLATLLLGALLAALFAAQAAALVATRGTPAELAGLFGVGVVVLVLGVLWAFHRLRVTVADGVVTLGFGPFRRRVELSRIAEARAVTYRAWAWGGWGIRWRPGVGTLWNVPGDEGRAVELVLEGGKRLLFSSRDPEAAVAAIERARAAAR